MLGKKTKSLRLKVPEEVAAIRKQIAHVLNSKDRKGRIIGNAKYGVYAFYDYDGEPIYVGQTWEKLRGRIGRHLNNQRTDAVAMNVLDPFEVAEIELWPFFDLSKKNSGKVLNRAEFAVYRLLLRRSKYKAILNEKPPTSAPSIKLPDSHRDQIIPKEIYERRVHPDIRIARRAGTIARLAHIISERLVSPGLRKTLLTQARRLADLAHRRLTEAPKVPKTQEEAEQMSPSSED